MIIIGGQEVGQKTLFILISVIVVLIAVGVYLFCGKDVPNQRERADEVRTNLGAAGSSVGGAREENQRGQSIAAELRQENKLLGTKLDEISNTVRTGSELDKEERAILQRIRARGPVRDYTLER